MTATKPRLSTSTIPSSPDINKAEALWASQELAAIIEKLGEESPVGFVLRHARQEIASLTTAPRATVIGPFRVAA